MFENYVEEQQALLPYLRKYHRQFPILQLPEVCVHGYSWDESKVKNNILKWLDEIINSAKEIQYAYCFSKAYNYLIGKYVEDTGSGSFSRACELRNFEYPIWIMCQFELLYSYREKIAHLILDPFFAG